MIRISRILCPIDFSRFSRRALDHAVALARWYESTLTLVHVWPVASIADPLGGAVLWPPGLTPESRAALIEQLRQAATEAGARMPVECTVVQGAVATEILRTAQALPADLLVMGTHGHSGFERLLLGSATETVLRKAACPVLTVPPAVVAEGQAPPPVLVKRILCGVDFSTCSRRALDYALSLAQEADAHLTVVHVVEVAEDMPRELDVTAPAEPPALREYLAVVERERRALLEKAIPDSARAYCTIDTMLVSGRPYREILRLAAEREAELLVVGIHGRGAIDRLLFGSTAQHLVRQATCPVLTLRDG